MYESATRCALRQQLEYNKDIFSRELRQEPEWALCKSSERQPEWFVLSSAAHYVTLWFGSIPFRPTQWHDHQTDTWQPCLKLRKQLCPSSEAQNWNELFENTSDQAISLHHLQRTRFPAGFHWEASWSRHTLPNRAKVHISLYKTQLLCRLWGAQWQCLTSHRSNQPCL